MSALLIVSGCGRQNRSENLVRIAVTGRAAAAYLPLYMGGPSGCFDQQGIQVQLNETAGAPKSMEALVGGSVEVAATDYFVLLNVVSQGQPVREFVLIQKIPGFAVVVSPKASNPIHGIEDLKGRSIGVTVPGGAYHRLFNHVLRLHGVKPDEVSVVGVGNGLSLALALERGAVEAGLGADLTINYLERRYPGLTFLFDTRTAAATREALGVEEMAFFILCARASWLKDQPDTARRLATATQCAMRWAQEHTEQEIRKILPGSTLSPDESADYDWITAAKSRLSTDGRMTAEAHAAAVRLLLPEAAGKFKEQELFTNEFLKP